jgi:cytochrome b involved in lipid metabolism
VVSIPRAPVDRAYRQIYAYTSYGQTILLDEAVSPAAKSTVEVNPDTLIRDGPYLTLQEVAKHNLAQDTWVILNGNVYE